MLSGSPFKGKFYLITGGGSGLGLEISKTLSSYGAGTYILGRDEEKLAKAKNQIEEYGNECNYFSVDIRDYEAVRKIVDDIFSSYGIDGLINNAAGNFISRTEDLSMNAFLSVINIVLNGSINITLEAAKKWIENKRKGTVLSILTTYAETGSGFVIPSAAAKGGLSAFTKSIAVEWGPKGIRANGIAPGPFKTEGAWKNLIPDQSFEDYLINKNPMKRLGNTKEISELAAFLLSDYSSFINGEVIRIDGGEFLRGAGQFNDLSMLSEDQWEKIRSRRNKK
ncbi:SDR family oxidoreductase [Cuniculiplasma sp. SKW4]|uniref:SDR family oxidoreductase n=1 Tax=Cuniculiplasma sp. SKW4 TaxID=3400171 RepID=UPI003FD30F0A